MVLFKFCAVCDAAFFPTRRDAKFCSSACRQACYRAREAAKATEAKEGRRLRRRPADALAQPGLKGGPGATSGREPLAYSLRAMLARIRSISACSSAVSGASVSWMASFFKSPVNLNGT